MNGNEGPKPTDPEVLAIQLYVDLASGKAQMHIIKLSHQAAELLCDDISHSIPRY